MSKSIQPDQDAFGPPQPFPYLTNLTNRQFEELLWSVFNRHLVVGQEPYCHLYDAAHLMPGVGESEQDVISPDESVYLRPHHCFKHVG